MGENEVCQLVVSALNVRQVISIQHQKEGSYLNGSIVSQRVNIPNTDVTNVATSCVRLLSETV